MFMRTPSALRLTWLRGDRHGLRRLLPGILVAIGAGLLFCLFAVPQLARFRFRAGLSKYDLGFYGFGPSQSFVSFDEESRIIEISPANAQCDPRYTFIAPRGDSVAHAGPMILDAQGELVWAKYNWGTTQDFKVQRFQGQDYVTYWQGDEEDGHGRGSWYMLDSTYTIRYIVSPVGLEGDLHDFVITSNDTALVTIYDPIPADLTAVGGPELGWLYDGVFQEIDIATGELLFEWRSSDFYPPESSYYPLNDRGHERTLGYDYYHMNSIDKDDQGRYLVSGRHTHTVTCVDGTTGQILWTLGGKHNDFHDESDGAATDFNWQHDARWQSPNSITLLNNNANGEDGSSRDTVGLFIELDIPARQAKVRTTYVHPQGLMATSQGNLQVLDTGNVLVGWGHSAAFTEYTAEGEIVCDVHFGASAYFTFGRIVSYRSFKGDWVGRPNTLPDAAIADDSIFVSWNGATEIVTWCLEAWDGESLDNVTFTTVDQVERTGFETRIPIPPSITSYFRVSAMNIEGEVLGTTETLSLGSPSSRSSYVSIRSWGVIIIAIFALGCLLFGCFCAVSRVWRRRRPRSGGSYQLVGHKEHDDNESENGRLPI
ncbi:hypothetical protein N7476_007661 [Penicillium atrosanguineum]|uniref:ASST-domain-containing protein n=1 Tax=Penicillium atrosanguineum TaxID=1132637 RepID=A0A9W9U380_9EURO|nr:hypothetical protein N7476_007661 [Penicillium atrosanguineum]